MSTQNKHDELYDHCLVILTHSINSNPTVSQLEGCRSEEARVKLYDIHNHCHHHPNL